MYRLLLDLAYLPLALLYLPPLLYQMVVLKKNRRGWVQRFGFVKPRVGLRPCIWVHAVSLGEVNATRTLIAEIHKRLPAYDVVISATTDTGYAAACRHYKPKYVFRYPLDFSFVVRRTLDRIRPDALVLMELEVWPNLVAIACGRGIPVGIANGRVTEEKTLRRLRRPVLRTLARCMFADIAWIGAQNQTYADRFIELGAPAERVTITGTMKYDTAVIADRVPGDDRLAHALDIDLNVNAPLWVAGSTGPGEEEHLLDAFDELRRQRRDLQLAVIPRKPERFDEVARLIEARGFACKRRSRHPDLLGQDAREADRHRRREQSSRSAKAATPANDRATVILGDTMGELRKFYALAGVVFVGRSLVPLGGSDLMEVAGLARPMCFGPHTENFADVTEKLLAADAAVRLGGPGELVPAIGRLLDDAECACAMGGRAQDVIRANLGATTQTMDMLCESLGRRAD